MKSRICHSLGYVTVWEESSLGFVLSGICYSLCYVSVRVVSSLCYVTVWDVSQSGLLQSGLGQVWVKSSLG